MSRITRSAYVALGAAAVYSGSVHGAPLAFSAGGSVAANGTLVPSLPPVALRQAQLRNVPTRSDRRVRAFFEFGLADLAGPVIQSATVSSGFFEQVAPGTSVGPASITYFVYGSNDGALTTGDYDNFDDPAASAIVLGSVVRPDGSGGWTESIVGTDLTSAVQSIVDAGFTHLGFGAQLDPGINFTATTLSLNQLDIDVVAVPSPGGAALTAVFGFIACRRRRASR